MEEPCERKQGADSCRIVPVPAADRRKSGEILTAVSLLHPGERSRIGGRFCMGCSRDQRVLSQGALVDKDRSSPSWKPNQQLEITNNNKIPAAGIQVNIPQVFLCSRVPALLF